MHTFDESLLNYHDELSRQCSQQDLDKDLVELNQHINAMQRFNHLPHITHLGIETLAFTSAASFTSILHRVTDYASQYYDHQQLQDFNQLIQRISKKIIECYSNLKQPVTYEQLLAYEYITYNLSPYVLEKNDIHRLEKLRHRVALQRSKMDLQIADHRYAQTKENLRNIAEEIQTLANSQENSSNNILSLAKITLDGHNNILENENNIHQKLEELGVQSTDQFIRMLSNQTQLAQATQQMLAYMDNAEKLRLEQIKKEYISAQYQGLSDACQFVGLAAQMTGNKTLMKLADITQTSVKITQIVHGMISNGISLSLATLSPFSLIGTLGFNLANSLFGSSSDNNAEILRQLKILSKQIDYLHKDVIAGFNGINEQFKTLFKFLNDSFRYFTQSFAIPINRKLDDLSQDVGLIYGVLQQGVEDILLFNLREHRANVAALQQGTMSEKNLNIAYLRTQLARYATIESCVDSLNGQRLISYTVDNIPPQLIEALRRSSLMNMYGFLAHDFNAKTQTTLLNPRKMPNPIVWLLAADGYLNILTYNIKDDATKRSDLRNEIQEVITIGKQCLLLSDAVRSSPQLFNGLFQQLLQKFDALQLIYERVNNSNIYLQPYAQGRLPRTPHITFHPVIEKGERGHRFISIETILKENFLAVAFSENGVEIPQIYLEAEFCGLGEFHIGVHQSLSNKARQWVKTSKPVRYGLDIEFVFKTGEKVRIFTAKRIEEQWQGERDPNRQKIILKNIFESKVKEDSLLSHTENDIQLVTRKVLDFKHEQQKAVAREITAVITERNVDKLFIWLQYLIISYMKVAGFPKNLIEQMIEIVHENGLLIDLNNYTAMSQNITPFPKLNILNKENISQIMQGVLRYLSMDNLEFNEGYNEIHGHVSKTLCQLTLVMQSLVNSQSRNMTSTSSNVNVNEQSPSSEISTPSKCSWGVM